jgi:hypothetical protein
MPALKITRIKLNPLLISGKSKKEAALAQNITQGDHGRIERGIKEGYKRETGML